MLFWVILQPNEKLPQPKPFFNCPSRLSISMFLQNISPNRLFLHYTRTYGMLFCMSYFYSSNSLKYYLSQSIFNCPFRLSISLFLQNISLNGLFLHYARTNRMLFWVILLKQTHWNITSANPFFNCPFRLSISMCLQNISPNGLFLHYARTHIVLFWVILLEGRDAPITDW